MSRLEWENVGTGRGEWGGGGGGRERWVCEEEKKLKKKNEGVKPKAERGARKPSRVNLSKRLKKKKKKKKKNLVVKPELGLIERGEGGEAGRHRTVGKAGR